MNEFISLEDTKAFIHNNFKFNFVSFLFFHEAFDKFTIAYQKYVCDVSSYDAFMFRLRSPLRSENGYAYVSLAFPWIQTGESQYWSQLSKTWKEQIENENLLNCLKTS